MTTLFISLYIKLFFLLTPFFVLTVFLTLTDGLDRTAQQKMAVRVTVSGPYRLPKNCAPPMIPFNP